MIAYHEIAKDSLSAIRRNGLVQGKKGDKRNSTITVTDAFLNTFRPMQLKEAGADRLENIYAYLSDGENVIDIVDGQRRPPADIPHDSSQTLIRLEIDPLCCYVSDLDLYDEIKSLYTTHSEAKARRLAEIYWQRFILLQEYKGNFRRPELLITYDVAPENISLLAEV